MHFLKDLETKTYKRFSNRVMLSRFRGRTTCPDCRELACANEPLLMLKVRRNPFKNIVLLPIDEALPFFEKIELAFPPAKNRQTDYSKKSSAAWNLMDQVAWDKFDFKTVLTSLPLRRLNFNGSKSQLPWFLRGGFHVYILTNQSIGLHPKRLLNRIVGVLKVLRYGKYRV